LSRADQALTGLPALQPLEGRANWHWQGPGGWIRAEGVAWRSLPGDGPFECWDEEGNQHFEDAAACERRHRDALDRLYAAAGPPGSAAASAAVTWAREADLQPDPAAVAAALDSDSVFPEDVFLQLLTALGIPAPPTEDYF